MKIYINPKVPEWMDTKPLEDRSESHMSKWWDIPYIITEEYWEDTYEYYCERCKGIGKLETEAEFNARIESQKESWFKSWIDGIRYDVRCLDGGAWDRTTNHGSYRTLEEAEAKCKEILEK